MCNVQLTVKLDSSTVNIFWVTKYIYCALFFPTTLASPQLPTVVVLFYGVWVAVLIEFALYG